MKKSTHPIRKFSLSFFALSMLLAQAQPSYAMDPVLPVQPQGEDIQMLPEDEVQIQELQSETTAYLDESADVPIITAQFKADLAKSEAQYEKAGALKVVKAQKNLMIRKHS